MALPTGNLTFHADASVDTDLWQSNVAGVMTDHPTDGEEVFYWDDVEHGSIVGAKNVTSGPLWRSGTPLMLLPCLDFDGSTQSFRMKPNNLAGGNVLSDIITNSAFTVLASVYVEGITSNAANSYDNDAIFGDSGGYMGIKLKNNSDPHVLFANYDGSDDFISLAVSLNTSYVLMFRHEGGNIYASLNGGSETSAASGNTGDMTGEPRIGLAFSSFFFNGRMGEIAIYNAALTGSDLTDAITYFTDKWLEGEEPPVATPAVQVFSHQYMQRRG